MMGDIEFDTDDPEYEEAAPQLGVVLKPMIGMSMTMQVDKDGKVVSFTGMDAINKKISEEAVASMLWEQMKDEFTDEHARRSWGTDPLLIYPNKSVKVGDTWTGTSSFTQSRIGTIITDYRYKVDRIGEENGRKVVVIGVTGVVSRGPDAEADTDAEPDSGSTEPGSDEGGEQEQGTDDEETKKALPETEANGSMSGTAVYDVKLGRIVKQDDEGNVEIRIPLARLIPEMGDSAGDQIATFKSTVKSTFVIRTEDERNAEKAEARKKAEMRRKAEQEEEEDEEDEEDDE